MQQPPVNQQDGKGVTLPLPSIAATLVSEQLGPNLRELAHRVEIKPLEKLFPLPTGPLIKEEYPAPISAHLYGTSTAVAQEADRAQIELIRRIGGTEALWNSFLRDRLGSSYPEPAKLIIAQFEDSMDWAKRTVVEFKEKGKHGRFNNYPDFMGRLEQLHIGTAAFLDLYGNDDQRKKAVSSLLWDMEHNSGFERKDPNIDGALGDFRRSYAIAGRLAPKQFERFGEVVDAIATIVISKYPQHIGTLRNAIVRSVLNNNLSFSGGFLEAVRGDPRGALGTALGESNGPYDAEPRMLAMGLFNQRMLNTVESLRQHAEQAATEAKTKAA